jgi:hypothetical protein
MSISISVPLSPREKVLDEAASLVAWAAHHRKVVPAGRAGERLYRDNPGCQMSESGIIEHIVRLAMARRLAIDTSR